MDDSLEAEMPLGIPGRCGVSILVLLDDSLEGVGFGHAGELGTAVSILVLLDDSLEGMSTPISLAHPWSFNPCSLG